MPDSGTKLAADTWGALLQVHAALVPRLDRLLRQRAALPLGWYDALLELQAAPDRQLTMTQLAERVVLSRTRVSRVVDELVREGYVRREANASDARSAFAVLTDTGLDKFRQAAPVYLESIKEEFAGGLTERELRTLLDALTRVRERLRDRR
jgi:DNA-binding MarR family transcriptional regulator